MERINREWTREVSGQPALPVWQKKIRRHLVSFGKYHCHRKNIIATGKISLPREKYHCHREKYHCHRENIIATGKISLPREHYLPIEWPHVVNSAVVLDVHEPI